MLKNRVKTEVKIEENCENIEKLYKIRAFYIYMFQTNFSTRNLIIIN